MSKPEWVFLVLMLISAIANIISVIVFRSYLNKIQKYSISMVDHDEKKQNYHEYDLQHRLENFQKMKFANLQLKSRLTKETLK